MRKLYVILAACLLTFASCGDFSGGVKFKPTEIASNLTDQERTDAIAKKKSENNLDPEVVLFQNNIKLSVLPPAESEFITSAVQLRVAERLMQITSIQGLGANGGSPCFAIAAMMTPIKNEVTGTVPQKYLCSFEVNVFVGNMVDGSIYAGVTQVVSGVGNSFESATLNAAGEIKNSQAMQDMLKSAESQIIDWYNNNIGTIRSQVAKSISEANYEMAYAILACVPEQCKSCYAYASKEKDRVLSLLQTQKAEESLSDMKDAITRAGVHYNPDVAACYKMIPSASPQYKKATALYDKYQASIERAYKDSVAFEKHKFDEQLAFEKMKLKYQCGAANTAMSNATSGKSSFSGAATSSTQSSKGFFKNEDGSTNWNRVGWTALGVTALGVGAMGSMAINAAGAILSRSLFLFVL